MLKKYFRKSLYNYINNPNQFLNLYKIKFPLLKTFPSHTLLSSKSFSTKLDHKLDEFNQPKESPEEQVEIELREIQKTPKYEAAIGFVVAGDYDRAIKMLSELKKKILEENNHISGDYLFLLKKLISVNKIARNSAANIDILHELTEISKRIHSTDFNNLFDNIEYVIINLNDIEPKETIKYIKEILDENIFPAFFDHIFKYYLGSAYILEGISLDIAIEILSSIENEIDDKYLKCCVLNNKACALWWEKLRYFIAEMEKNKAVSYELLDQIAKEIFSIVKIFKNGLIQIEDLIDLKYEDRINYISIYSIADKNEEEIKKNFLNYLLTINFDVGKSFDQNFVKEIGQHKNPITNVKTSAIVYSNLGELYFNVREYKKSLVFFNIANLFFQNFQKNDPLFFKNLALVALNNWKLTAKSENPKNMFDKIIKQLKQYPNGYEKVFVLRSYGEMLIEENNQNIYANNLLEEAKAMEDKLQYFECRKNYLTLPKEE